MSIEQRLQKAYQNFRNSAREEEKQAVLKLLSDIHNNTWDALNGAQSSVHNAEFAHALAIVEPQLAKRGQLPQSATELLTPKVQSDGSILGTGKWELLDPGWIESLIGWLEHLEHQASFSTEPTARAIPNSTSLAIAGDWGTGYWRTTPTSPAENVANVITSLKPDISLHLGDVYYAGTAEQEKNNLIDIWPAGRLGSYTLNSNHEMYNGALAYFDALAQHFTLQQGCSYFSLENDHWLIVGLDSAYHSDKWNLYMDGQIESDQRDWLAKLPAKQGLILLSHHTGYDLQGNKPLALYNEVLEPLLGSNGSAPRYEKVYWYWGHAHNAVIYKPNHYGSTPIYNRCIGHAAVPYGNASELANANEVLWYETELANDPTIPIRVLNGFAHIELQGTNINESLIAENGQSRWSPVSA